MWQEMRAQRAEGAFGDPTALDSLILYWSMMEQLHYPMAGTIKAELQRQKQAREEQAAEQAQTAAGMAQDLSGMADQPLSWAAAAGDSAAEGGAVV